MPWVIWTSCHQTSRCPQERPGKLAFQTEQALFSLHDVSFLKVKGRKSTKSMELRSRLSEFLRGHSIKLDDKSGLQGQSQRRCKTYGPICSHPVDPDSLRVTWTILTFRRPWPSLPRQAILHRLHLPRWIWSGTLDLLSGAVQRCLVV